MGSFDTSLQHCKRSRPPSSVAHRFWSCLLSGAGIVQAFTICMCFLKVEHPYVIKVIFVSMMCVSGYAIAIAAVAWVGDVIVTFPLNRGHDMLPRLSQTRTRRNRGQHGLGTDPGYSRLGNVSIGTA